MFQRILISLLLMTFSNKLIGQDLGQHQWQNRLLLVVSKDSSNTAFREQLATLNSCKPGLKERKLLLYQVLPDQYKMVAPSENNGSWSTSSDLYQQFNPGNEGFGVILIGLDGGVKLRKNAVLPCEELWAVIDQMPMRRAEIRRQKYSR